MATTPPLQITSTPGTPPSPLHGAAYDRIPTRQSARIRQRVASQDTPAGAGPVTARGKGRRIVSTPNSSARTSSTSQIQSPRSTPKKPTRRVQVISPSSPNTESTPPKPTRVSHTHLHPFTSANTTMSEGMLPTPVKTPKKRHVPGVNEAARALFQDATLDGEDVAPTPRKNRKNRKYNGFSLENMATGDQPERGRVQVFTDNRDKVPELDTSESNPFIDHSQIDSRARKVAVGTKRRKVTGKRQTDPQVAAAIKQDEGMVYVFRGKKVYRRFDDTGEEEEEIDAEDLGLLEHTDNGAARVKPLKTLTRKTIKPRRLFQNEKRKRANNDVAEEDEEALTDIDEPTAGSKAADAATTDSAENQPSQLSQESSGKTTQRGVDKPKKASPFDSWPRVKAGSRSSAGSGRGQKRTASEAMVDESGDTDLAESSRPRKSRS